MNFDELAQQPGARLVDAEPTLSFDELAKRKDAKVVDAEAPKKGPQVSKWQALLSGVGQAAGGFGDELGALGQAELAGLTGLVDVARGKTSLRELPGEVAGTYRAARSENRQLDEASREQHPLPFYGGMAGGILASAPAMPSMAVAKGAGFGSRLLANALTGTAQGGLYGAGASEADLTKDELGKFAKDVGRSAAVGGVTSGVLGAAGAGLRAIRGRAVKGAKEAAAAEEEVQRRLAEKAIKSKQGEYRSSIQSASRDIEVLERAAQGSDDVAQKARAWLQSPEAEAVRAQVATSKLGTAPERIAEMGTLREQLGQLVAGKQDNIATQTAEALKDPVRKHVAPRLLTLAHRLAPPAMATVGGLVGGGEGALVGGALGAVMSLVQGHPGRIVKNLLEKPATRKLFWEKVITMGGGATRENVAMVTALEAAAEKGPQAFLAALREAGVPVVADEGATPPQDRARALRDALEQRQ